MRSILNASRLVKGLLLAVLCAPPMSFAQPMRDDFIDMKCKAMAMVILDELKTEISKYPHLPDIADIVYFTPTIDFNALADTDYRKIYISRAMCQELFRLADGTAIMRHAFPETIWQLTGYAKYLAEQSTLANRNTAPGEFVVVELARFTDWAKLDLSRVTSDMNIKALEMRDVLLHDSLSMIIGHELGHLINQDRHERLTSYGELQHAAEMQMARWREAAADKIALRITQPLALMDGNPASLSALISLLNRSHAILITDNDQTHPPTVCRISYLMLKSGYYEELAKADIPPKLRQQMNALAQEEAAKRGLTIKDYSELKAVQEQLLNSEPCVDYWAQPWKIYSAATQAVGPMLSKQALSQNAAAAPFMISAMLTGAADWQHVKSVLIPFDLWACGEATKDAPLTLISQPRHIAIQCRNHQQRLTPKPIFDAITAGRPFLAKYARPGEASPRFALVYGVLMRYAGIPRMMSVYYVDLDSFEASEMDAAFLFSPGSSGMVISILK